LLFRFLSPAPFDFGGISSYFLGRRALRLLTSCVLSIRSIRESRLFSKSPDRRPHRAAVAFASASPLRLHGRVDGKTSPNDRELSSNRVGLVSIQKRPSLGVEKKAGAIAILIPPLRFPQCNSPDSRVKNSGESRFRFDLREYSRCVVVFGRTGPPAVRPARLSQHTAFTHATPPTQHTTLTMVSPRL
jgi:hypothetical protein